MDLWTVAFDRDATLEKLAKLAAEASAGARLAVFPEAFLSGYPRGVSFGTVVGNRTAEGRDQFRRYWDSSVDVPGPAVERLVEIAALTSGAPRSRIAMTSAYHRARPEGTRAAPGAGTRAVRRPACKQGPGDMTLTG
jgi:hypothetical protein